MDCLIRLAAFRGIINQNLLLKSSRFYCNKPLDVTKSQWKKRIFSGIQPTGSLHLGNYFGAINRWTEFQNNGEDVIYCIVDLHSITLPQDPNELKKNILDCTATLLACGINAEKSTLYLQSMISQHAELSWIFSCITTMPRLSHLPQFKEKSAKLKDIPLGLYLYPVLQSADILLYKATHVPVGEDQIQHIQLANHLSNAFNRLYGKTFPPIKCLLDENESLNRIRSLRNPEKKMSKSDPDIKSRINLDDEPEIILEKCKKAVTDFISEVAYDPINRRGVATLIELMSLSSGKSIENVCNDAIGIDTGKFKLHVADSLCEFLKNIRNERKQLLNNTDYLIKVLKSGSDKANEIASKTMIEVKNKVGIGIL